MPFEMPTTAKYEDQAATRLMPRAPCPMNSMAAPTRSTQEICSVSCLLGYMGRSLPNPRAPETALGSGAGKKGQNGVIPPERRTQPHELGDSLRIRRIGLLAGKVLGSKAYTYASHAR